MPFLIFDSDIFIQYIYETLSIFHNKELIQTDISVKIVK